jgi:peroxiredoxin
MMKIAIMGALVAMGLSTMAQAAASGEAAPAFEVQDSQGKTHKLSDYAGKHVVLEWTNPGCPFVQKHYKSGNMQKLQKEWTDKGVVWFTVTSAAPGKSGHNTPAWWNEYGTKQGIAATALLLDDSGTVGRAYGAKTTPHVFVIDGAGKLVYQGAIDDKAGTDPAENATAKNHVAAALTESLAGQAVTTAQTQPYGCGVKY